MDFDLTGDQRAIQALCREFARDEVRPRAEEIDAKAEFPYDLVKKMAELGAGEILLTSMDRDGTRSGYDLALTRAVSDAVSVPVIASGGVGTLDDLRAGLVEGGASAVLAASIFHDGVHSIEEAKLFLARAGVAVRPPSPSSAPQREGVA